MLKIIDTNILLDFPQIIEKEEDLVIIVEVLRELDGLKLNQNQDTAFKARRAAVVLSHHLDKIKWIDKYEEVKENVDDKLLLCTKEMDGILITNDVYLKVKATIKGIQTKGWGGGEEYSGVINWKIKLDEVGYNKELEQTLQTKSPIFSMRENQYLIVKNEDTDDVLNIFVYKNKQLIEVKYHEIKNKWVGKIKPRPNNPEQICLFDALSNKDYSILYAGGPQGVGKTYLLNNYALQQLEQEDIKIIYIPNNAYVENSMELGFLPGDSLEKITPMLGQLIDLIGMDEVSRLIAREQLEIIPLAYLRGRSFDNAIVIVNEAQNLTPNHVKLLIGRIGNNSRIFFDGSLQQIDSDIFKNKNGLRSLLQLSNSEYSDLFATVRLEKIERSRTAQVADYLDELGGF